MFKHQLITIILLASVLAPGVAYCQEKAESQRIGTIIGTITKVDTVGDIISIHTESVEMAFSVPGQAKIVRNTHDIGLLDIKDGDSVTVQYNNFSPGKNSIISIVVNETGNSN